MKTRRITTLGAAFMFACGIASTAMAQDDDDAPAITARVHGTFVDKAGGAGVLSGDMSIVRFEVQNGTVTAIGRIVGALADSTGKVLGRVNEELALPVRDAESTCNQLRMQLAATDADVLGTQVHFDRETAGFDSREGATPRALGVLCAAGETLRKNRGASNQVQALNDVAIAIKAKRSR